MKNLILVFSFLISSAFLASTGKELMGQTQGSDTRTPEATSLFGKSLYRMTLSADQSAELEANFAKAKADYDKDLWRAGGSSDLILEKWRQIAEYMTTAIKRELVEFQEA